MSIGALANSLPRVAIYARVSTEEQAEQGYSIDAQLEALNAYCRASRKIVYKEYVDRGISGKSIKGRLALQQLLADGEKSLFDEVLVWKINRLARNQIDLLRIVDALNRQNVSFRSFTENFETETPMGKFALQMMGAVGELERNTIVDNVKLGMKQRARTGKWNGGIVLGYRSAEVPSSGKKRETRLEVVPEEAALVRRIFDLFVSGKGYRPIANQLNREGYRTKKGNPFSVCTVKEIVNNPLYVGKIRYNVRQDWSVKRRKGTNPDPILVDGEHEPIIPPEVWEKARELVAKKAGRPPRSFDGTYPLTGLLRCPVCGQGMVAARTRNRLKGGGFWTARYYVCGDFKNKGPAVCRSNGVRADKAEEYVFGRLREVILNKRLLKDIVARVNETRTGRVRPLREELDRVSKAVEEAVRKREKYFRLYEEDAIDKEMLASRLDGLGEEIASLEDRREKILRQLDDRNSQPVPYEVVAGVLRRFRELLDSSPPNQRKTLLQLIIREITVTDNRDIGTIRLQFDDRVVKHFLGPAPSGDKPEGAFFLPGQRAGAINFSVSI